MEKKLWIIGDSFTISRHKDPNKCWPSILSKEFNGESIILPESARDIQSILDIFLKVLYKISDNDFVILFLPTTTRYRIPLKKEYRYSLHKSLNLYHQFKPGGQEILQDGRKFLEYPFDIIDYNNFKNAETPENFSNTKEDTEQTILNPTKFLKLINASNANIENYNEIFYSLLNFVKFKLVLCSWADELNPDIVYTKSVLEKEIGMWESLNDLFNKSNGELGLAWDFHWSETMDVEFAKYILKKYSEYFKNNIKLQL